MFFKVAFKKQIHVVNIAGTPTLAELNSWINKVFNKLPRKYILTYLDSDGDEIAIGNQADMAILIEDKPKTIKIKIEQISEQFFDQTAEVALQTIQQKISPSQVQPSTEQSNTGAKEEQVPVEKKEISNPIEESGNQKQLQEKKDLNDSETVEQKDIMNKQSHNNEENPKEQQVQVELRDEQIPYQVVKRQEQSISWENKQEELPEEKPQGEEDKKIRLKEQIQEKLVKKQQVKKQQIKKQQKQQKPQETEEYVIESKMRSMMPDFINRVKEELQNTSRLKQMNASQIEHKGIQCALCARKPIRGIRYRCAICEQYDLCSNCQEIEEHGHPFLKIKSPSLCPKYVDVSMEPRDKRKHADKASEKRQPVRQQQVNENPTEAELKKFREELANKKQREETIKARLNYFVQMLGEDKKKQYRPFIQKYSHLDQQSLLAHFLEMH